MPFISRISLPQQIQRNGSRTFERLSVT